MDRSQYNYNNLKEIDNLRHEVITDKTLTYHDSLFKIIIIGDSGNFNYLFILNDWANVYYWLNNCHLNLNTLIVD